MESQHDVPEQKCHACGKALDKASSLTTERRPDPGDVTICFGCGHIMAFDTDLSLRELTEAEIVEVAGDPDIIKTQKLIALAHKYAPRHPK